MECEMVLTFIDVRRRSEPVSEDEVRGSAVWGSAAADDADSSLLYRISSAIVVIEIQSTKLVIGMDGPNFKAFKPS